MDIQDNERKHKAFVYLVRASQKANALVVETKTWMKHFSEEKNKALLEELEKTLVKAQKTAHDAESALLIFRTNHPLAYETWIKKLK